MNKIFFNPVSELTYLSVDPPKSSKNYIPDWYKRMPAFQNSKPSFDISTGRTDRTLKMCMPFLDSLSSGYIQETWQDIRFFSEIDANENVKFSYNYPTKPDIVSVREPLKNKFPIPEDFYQFELSWHPVWIPQLPKGYSAIISHPMNREDLPFRTLTGIVDHDTFSQSQEGSNIPFLLKKDFSGIIKKGTPMYQIFPFKRDDWESIISPYSEKNQIKSVQKLRQHFWGGYKKHHWNKKNYL